jgi:hypothetical protein
MSLRQMVQRSQYGEVGNNYKLIIVQISNSPLCSL